MKILFSQSNNRVTGQEISLLERMRALRNINIESELLLPEEGDFSDLVMRNGFKSHFLNLNRFDRKNPLPYLETILSISKLIKSNEFSLVHCSSVYPNQYCLPAARLKNVPCVINVNSMVYSAYDLKSSLAHKASYIMAVSKGAEKLIATLCPPMKHKITTIYDNIDVPLDDISADRRLQIRQQYGIREQDILIGQVGELIERKGFEYFVEMAAIVKKSHPNTKFLIIGKSHQDDYEQRVRAVIEKHNLKDDVILAGFQTDVLNYINALDMLVLAALSEGLGRVLVEGQKLRKPVVGSNIEGIDEAIEHQKTGLLAEVKNGADLAKNIQFLLDHPQERAQYIENALVAAADKFDQTTNVQRLVDVYESLVNKK